jgi:hypothetical protein
VIFSRSHSAFHQVLDAIVSPGFYVRHVRLPKPNSIPSQIESSTKFSSYFNDCLAAVDGSHFAEFCLANDAA